MLSELVPGALAELGLCAAARAARIEGKVDQHLPGVGPPVLHRSHPWPAMGQTKEAFLHQVFRLGDIPDDQVGGTQEPLGRLGDEPVELVPGPASAHDRTCVSITLLNPSGRAKGCLPPAECFAHPVSLWGDGDAGHERAAGDLLVAGLDGCRAGWVLATVRAMPSGRTRRTPPVDIRVIDGLETVADDLASRRLVAAGIDIPIGLPPGGPRACDVAARRMLGPRRSTIFPAPARAVLEAEGYEQACALSRAASGKAISKQTFNILPKIREVDRSARTRHRPPGAPLRDVPRAQLRGVGR